MVVLVPSVADPPGGRIDGQRHRAHQLPDLLVSDRFPAATFAGLAARGHHPMPCDDGLLQNQFASPVVIRRAWDRAFEGGVDPWYHPATAIGIDGG